MIIKEILDNGSQVNVCSNSEKRYVLTNSGNYNLQYNSGTVYSINPIYEFDTLESLEAKLIELNIDLSILDELK
jgi:hypothetical protein